MKKIDREIKRIYEWIEHIENIVGFHSFHKEGEKYNRVANCWIWGVVDYMLRAKDKDPKFKDSEKDGVLSIALMIGTFFFAWYFRTHLAKVYDPKRGLKGRKIALRQVIAVKERMMRIMELEPMEQDKKIYKQEWEYPK